MPVKGGVPWNKGLTKETSEIVKLSAEKFSKKMKGIPGKKHSQETKEKISKSRIAFLKENPDKVPYVLNHYSNGESYPETYFTEVFENAGLKFQKQLRVSIYRLDFAFVDKMICVEIDGEQHYVDKRVIKSNKRRDEYLSGLGWKTIRVRWSKFQSIKDKEKFIEKLLARIT